jgi:hypothetical protein
MISINPLFTPASAAVFASAWIEAWNTRDLDLILSHYAWDVELSSPFVRRLLDCHRDTVHGLAALRTYFARGLDAYPDLRFTLRRTYCGVQSLVLEYESVSNLVTAEAMEFNEVGLVCRVRAHYAPAHASAGSTA